MKRTHSCGEITEKSLGKKVSIAGWVSNRRDHGLLTFIDLRDREGETQVVFNAKESKSVHETAKKLGKEFVICIEGKVGKRPKGTENTKIKTGKIEVTASKLEILNAAKQPLPIEVDEHLLASEEQRLKYRYLDLRRPELQKRLILRHKIIKAFRDFFDKEGFIEIETPILAKSTPEGARDYLVPSRVHAGKFFALPQSPQIFKQLCMVAGFEKYIQIARCFRDEDLRADRQPEFTQVDVEMSFVEQEEVLDVIERSMAFVLKTVLKEKIKTPFPKISWENAMNTYGTDSPDIRYGLEFTDLTEELKDTEFQVFSTVIKEKGSIKAIVAPKGGEKLSKKDLNELLETAKTHHAKGLLTLKVQGKTFDSNITKYLKPKHIESILKKTSAKENDLVLLIADSWKVSCAALGTIRKTVAQKLGLIDEKKKNFLWVTDFPLFEFDEEEQRLKAMHHPFTRPKKEDIALLEKEPLKVKSDAYDLVLNGFELGGGSIRIHERELQEKMFKALGISKENAEQKFGFLMGAFQYGAPPHGGIALGLDRVVLLLTNADSLRDVIAFPKTKAAVSLMDEAPSEVSEQQLKELHLKRDLSK
ncbi:aspartate--tRNA ligase [Candidatus Micrarchaeota archaeon]|nr:aspartate--tRNA ligase [Candidatus Micrarchaeota archaeon]MBU1930675.1 aspartate--tRNA ligase [Candidatus Micrarchaeota archaeon]